jgi:hypothetical protein
MASCCERILAEFTRLSTYSVWSNQNLLPELNQIFNLPAGAFIPVPGGVRLPTLAELLNRLQTPLNVGFGEWWWYNFDQPGKTNLTLPQIPVVSKTRVALNSVRLLNTRDYSLSGTSLVFTEPLSVGDLVWIKTYGV